MTNHLELQDCPEPTELFRLEALARSGTSSKSVKVAESENRKAAYWASCQLCTHLFNSIIGRDPWTGEPLPATLQDALQKLSDISADGQPAVFNDALAFIASQCQPALEAIFDRPRRRSVREHAMLPVHRVRELDTSSMVWFTRQPGRSVQQKVGARQKLLAPVRLASLNTLENAVARLVTGELVEMLEKRLTQAQLFSTVGKVEGAAGQQSQDPLPGQESQVLVSFDQRLLDLFSDTLALCSDGAIKSGLNDLPIREVGEPNNVLLSHPDYHQIWLTWLRLGEFTKMLERSWKEGPERFITTAFWFMISDLCARYHATVFNDHFLSGAGIAQEHFGFQPIILEDNGIDLWIDLESTGKEHEQALLRFRRVADGFTVEQYRLPRSAWCSLANPKIFQLKIEAGHDERIKPERFYPLKVWLHPHKRGPERLWAYADMEGLVQLSQSVTKKLIGEPSRLVRSRTTSPSKGKPLRHLAIDASGTVPRVFSEEGRLNLHKLTCARQINLGEFGLHWDIASMDRTFRPSVSSGQWFSAPYAVAGQKHAQRQLDSQDAALNRMFQELWSEIDRDQSAELAIAVSAQMSDFLQHRLRIAAGYGFSKIWMIERTTAAALGWQKLAQFKKAEVRNNDRILVLDAEAGTLRMSLLRAVCDSELQDTEIYWERNLSDAPWPESKNLSYRKWLEDYTLTSAKAVLDKDAAGDDQLRILGKNLIEQGEVERVLESGHTIRVPFPLGSEKATHFLSLHLSSESAKTACDLWLDRYRGWLRGVGGQIVKRAREIEQKEAKGESTPVWHVLYVGRPFQLPSIRDRIARVWQEAFPTGWSKRQTVHHTLAQAHLIVAEGAQSFLDRHYMNLPTWRDVLPDLFMEVEGEQGPETRQILKKATARPGVAIDFPVEKSLVLPAYQDEYVLPVFKNSDQSDIAYNALLRPPGFPLKKPFVVRMNVHYQYGEDNYRLIVSPAEGQPPVFNKVEMEWIDLVDEAPSFGPTTKNQKLDKKLDDLLRSARALPKPLDDAGTRVEFAMPYKYRTNVESLREFVVTWLQYIEPLRHRWQVEIDLINTTPDASRQARNVIQQAMLSFIRLLIALDINCPDQLVKALVDKLRYRGRDDRDISGAALRMLEPIICDAKIPLHRTAFSNVIALLLQRFNRLDLSDPTKLRQLIRPIGTSAMILRSDPGFAELLSREELSKLLDLVEQSLGAIPKAQALVNWSAGSRLKPEQEEMLRDFLLAFRNTCELLMALLCLRAYESADAEALNTIRAGGKRMHRLAKLAASADRSFPPSYRLDKIEQRLVPPKGEHWPRTGMSGLVYALYLSLSGYNPLRLVQIEEESDQSI
jgi:hypothetical protein